MRPLALLLALIATTSASAADLSSRRFVLFIYQILETGAVQVIPFENNTFTTEATCEKAGQKIQQQTLKAGLRSPIVYACLDRGSAT